MQETGHRDLDATINTQEEIFRPKRVWTSQGRLVKNALTHWHWQHRIRQGLIQQCPFSFTVCVFRRGGVRTGCARLKVNGGRMLGQGGFLPGSNLHLTPCRDSVHPYNNILHHTDFRPQALLSVLYTHTIQTLGHRPCSLYCTPTPYRL
jgi:hypothetical protein